MRPTVDFKLVLMHVFVCNLVYFFVEDVLTEDKGECVICLDDLTQGDTIARLPCLCIYHKTLVLSLIFYNVSLFSG